MYMKTVLLITLKSKYGVLVKMSHFFRYTWDKFDHVLDHHFKTIKAMKVKFCIPVKVIGIHILTINKVYKNLHFLRYLQKKKKTSLFLKLPLLVSLEWPRMHARVMIWITPNSNSKPSMW